MLQDKNIELSPIMEPAPIPFTMDTLGWKIVFSLLFILISYIAYKLYIKYKHNAYRRDAVSQIMVLKTQDKETTSSLISQVMFLIKQTALQTYNRKEVAALQGENWLAFLDKKLHKPYYLKHQEVIASAIYKNEFNNTGSFNFNEFAETSITWIKKHA
ncbi:DUF4381 domain-containing protein [Tamlana agarivorans]|uniref:DUF4381 domain-containing protein n=1 Tax=Pseudotamlana agarivorans TaxID=481183 RepID=A0ACC5UCE5_9FLAO|nr:DUF4381 domain-containing protein [Tamlana agarivorans]MBU2951865.1 DUF4381 domain-containing protein [Tamlana agarivorans]